VAVPLTALAARARLLACTQAGSRVRLQHAAIPEEAKDLDRELRALLKEKDAAVRGQDVLHVQRCAGLVQAVQRIQVVAHVAIRRVNHRGAAVQYVIAREQKPIFFQHKTDVVGRMAGRENRPQRVGFGAAQP
jgi:ATP-dependent Clp protease ATP-binding subunit ClpA